MNLDTLLRIGVDAAAAWATVNLVNACRQGGFGLKIKRWLNAPRTKREKQARIIGFAWWISFAVAGVFALRVWTGGWQAFVGEWASRAIISWLLALGQFDVVKVVWPSAFDPNHREALRNESMDKS